MMKLKYNPTRWLSTADLSIACDPPILFEAKTRLTPEWAQVEGEWEDNGADNVKMALQLITEAFINVAQDDKKYPIKDKEDARALWDAIEESSPGEGDTFICHLLMAFAVNHYLFLAKNSVTYGRLSPPSNGIASPSTSKTGKVKV